MSLAGTKTKPSDGTTSGPTPPLCYHPWVSLAGDTELSQWLQGHSLTSQPSHKGRSWILAWPLTGAAGPPSPAPRCPRCSPQPRPSSSSAPASSASGGQPEGTQGHRRDRGRTGESENRWGIRGGGQRRDRGIRRGTEGSEVGQGHWRRDRRSEEELRPWDRSQGTPRSPPPLTLRFLRALASATFLMGRALISFQRCR